MQEEELKRIWNKSGDQNILINLSELIKEMKSKMELFDQKIRRRDRIEIIAGFIAIIMFTFLGFKFPFPSSKIAAVLGVIWAFYVIYRLRKAQGKRKPEDFSQSLDQQLNDYKQFLERQKKLLNSVWYWYALPPFVINVIFFIGMGELGKKLVVIGVLALFTAFVIFINLKAVRVKINPAINEVERLRQKLSETSGDQIE